MSPIHIIAEAGTNHNGNYATAKKLIDVAKKANADSVKFQIIYPEELYLPGIYEFGHYDIKEVVAMRKRFMLHDIEYLQLAQYSQELKILFTASIFDVKGLELVLKTNPPFIKIASTDLNNIYLLRKVAERGIKIILSTGMSSFSEIEKSINELHKKNFTDLVLMHCVSAYPAKLENMNLNFIDVLKSTFGYPVGLSDHTQGSIAACLALTKGVAYIEKHFTLDSEQEGFDHKYAAEPEEFIRYVDDIRKAEMALKEKEQKLLEDEIYVGKRARRSIYSKRLIKKGESITIEDLLIVRPSNILTADQIDTILGKRAKTDIVAYTPLSFDIIE